MQLDAEDRKWICKQFARLFWALCIVMGNFGYMACQQKLHNEILEDK